MAAKWTDSGVFFSKPWRERPSWSRATDIINVSLTVAVLLLVIVDAVRRWLGH